MHDEIHHPMQHAPQDPATAPAAAVVAWDRADETGRPDIDALARELLACCARLGTADPRDGGDAAGVLVADVAAFKAQVRVLFDAESAALAGADAALRDALDAEQAEFEAFADEVVTAEHFDRQELARFARLWAIGHLRSAAQRLREAGGASSADR
jgi:hypothetical protein